MARAMGREVSARWCNSWTGCPAALACLHYATEPARRQPTALCKACGGALEKMLAKYPAPKDQRRLRLRR